MNLLNHEETLQATEEFEQFIFDMCDRYVTNIQDQGRYDEFNLDYDKLMDMMKNDFKYVFFNYSFKA